MMMTIHSAKQKVSGVILVDKPSGMTSQQVVSKIKYLFKSAAHDSKKAGHTGTLDPMATGLLPICLGEATKFSHYQLDADKSYQATILLGAQTDTGDADGQIINQMAIPAVDSALLEAIARQFLGAQQQIPPMYSALKKDGKKLYEYARAGIEIERAPRNIVIKAIDLITITDDQLQLTVTCTKGTYVRVLGEDIAKALGTLGHLTALRRLQVGNFKIDDATTITQLEQLSLDERLAALLPIDACIDITASLTLDSIQCDRIKQGQRLNVIEQIMGSLQNYISSNAEQSLAARNDSDVDQEGSHQSGHKNSELGYEPPLLAHAVPADVRLIDEQGQFLGLGAVSLNGRLQPKKLIHY